MKKKQVGILGFLFLALFSAYVSAQDSNPQKSLTLRENGITVNYSTMATDYTDGANSKTVTKSERIVKADVYIDGTRHQFSVNFVNIYLEEGIDHIKKNTVYISLKKPSGNTVEDTFDTVGSGLEAKIVSYLTSEGVDSKNTNSISKILMRLANDSLK